MCFFCENYLIHYHKRKFWKLYEKKNLKTEINDFSVFCWACAKSNIPKQCSLNYVFIVKFHVFLQIFNNFNNFILLTNYILINICEFIWKIYQCIQCKIQENCNFWKQLSILFIIAVSYFVWNDLKHNLVSFTAMFTCRNSNNCQTDKYVDCDFK